jgi:5-methylcytosine-specific restriction endonuclease McrA
VLTRDGHKCRFCGDHKNLEAAHIVARTQSLNTKFDLENGLTLCSWCHRYWTGEPVEFAKRVALELGERFQALLARSGIKVYSPGPAWFQMRLDELKGMR